MDAHRATSWCGGGRHAEQLPARAALGDGLFHLSQAMRCLCYQAPGGTEFAGKIVFVGASAAGSYEVRPAGFETAPGIFVVATALDNLLAGEAARQAPVWLALLLVVTMTRSPLLPCSRRSIIAPLGVTLGLLIAYGAGCFLLYGHNYWLPMAAPMLTAALSFTGNTGWRYLTVDRELARTRGTLERYVSPQLVRHVMDNLDTIRFDGEKRTLTILFSDVRSFTTLTEKSDPVELLKQLNEYLEAMTDIIFRHDGIVDKFIGDGIMSAKRTHSLQTVPKRAGRAGGAGNVLEALRVLNEKWILRRRPMLGYWRRHQHRRGDLRQRGYGQETRLYRSRRWSQLWRRCWKGPIRNITLSSS